MDASQSQRRAPSGSRDVRAFGRREQGLGVRATLRGDMNAGVTAAVVMLPVGLAYGVAAGAGPIAGLYSAVASGFVAAVFGGAPALISGPTAPMTVAMAVIVGSHASSLEEAFTIVVLAGLIQILLGLTGIGKYVAYTPRAVISGFMSGVGIIIMLIQTLPALGAPAVPGGALGAIQAWPGALRTVNVDAICTAAVAAAVSAYWPRRFRAFVPAPVAALLIGTLAGMCMFRDAPVIGDVPAGLPAIQVPVLLPGFLVGALQPAFLLAMIGSVSSLLTALAADSLTRSHHHPSRALIGQGLGNVAAGLIGGLPGAGSNQGTTVSIHAGGRTPAAGVVLAGVLVALLLGFGRYAEPIPHAALAAIVMQAGWRLVDWRLLARARRLQRHHLFVLLLTIGLTVLVDLLTGVAIGLIAAGLTNARQLERLELDSVVSVPLLERRFFAATGAETAGDEFAARVGMVALRGRFTAASSRSLTWMISGDIPGHDVVVFDFSGTTYIDDSAAMVVEHLIGVAAEQGTACIVTGLSGDVAETLRALDALREVPAGHVVDTVDDARRLARRLLKG